MNRPTPRGGEERGCIAIEERGETFTGEQISLQLLSTGSKFRLGRTLVVEVAKWRAAGGGAEWSYISRLFLCRCLSQAPLAAGKIY